MTSTDPHSQQTIEDPRPGHERYVEPGRPFGRWRRRAGELPSIARGWRSLAPPPRGEGTPLSLEHVVCDLCGPSVVEPVGVGEDFEYWTSPDTFLAVRCRSCGLVFLDPRPSEDELPRIYPSNYHAFNFSEARYGLVHKVRERLEARRILNAAGDLPRGARILDVGCGDGFHLDLLERYGDPSWTVEGVEPDERAASAAIERGLTVHAATLDAADIEPGSFDLVILIQTIEHVARPTALLAEIAEALRPGGRLMVVTDNVDAPDFHLFGSRHWGGYHFPRHWHLYDRSTLSRTAEAAGLDVEEVTTIVSPVNWVYSLRNLLVDLGAPEALIRPLGLDRPVALAAGTVLDAGMNVAQRGALLRGTFRRP